MEVLKTTMLPMVAIVPNNGQIEGVPGNPRILDDKSMRLLVQSIQDNPEMLRLRELLVYKQGSEYVIIGGNMRWRAMCELGFTEAACKVIPEGTDPQRLRAYTIKDNVAYGEWDQEELEGWDAEELESWGVILRQKKEEEPETTQEMKTLEFSLTSEQFKHVKKVFRNEGETDAEALHNILKTYGRA